jgi:hypothetical protein
VGGTELGQAREREKEREYGNADGGRHGAQQRVMWAREDPDVERKPDEGHRDHVHGARD